MKIWMFLLLIWGPTLAKDYPQDELSAIFSGRISKLNEKANLMRIRVDFENMKFLNTKDRIEFWNETYPDRRCVAYLEGKSTQYILVKVPQYDLCVKKVHLTTGTYLHLFSPDLKQNLLTAKELVNVLVKKRMALQARKDIFKKELDTFMDKTDAVNKRYEVLRQKLEIEWGKEIAALEEDKLESYKNFKNTEARLDELEHKLMQYRVQDENLNTDRWSLDTKLYYKK